METLRTLNTSPFFARPSDVMQLPEKLAALQSATNLSLTALGDMIGIPYNTLHRIEIGHQAANRTLERIAAAFDGVTVDQLRDPDADLPTSIRFSDSFLRERKEDTNSAEHEGRSLYKYLERRNIRPVQLAKVMGLSRAQVHAYGKTVRFRQDVKDRVLSAIAEITNTKAPSGQVVFGGRNLREITESDVPVLVATPLLSAAERSMTGQELGERMQNFSPLLSPSRSFYFNSSLLTRQEDITRALCIEVSANDAMSPRYQAGAVLLAFRIEPENYGGIDGSVALLAHDRLYIRQIVRNDLSTTGVLEVSSYDRTHGGTLTVHKRDIQAMLVITNILVSPA